MSIRNLGAHSKLIAIITLVLICAYGAFLRCSHLLLDDHYYIISPDSYFFHWEAKMILLGEQIPLQWHSGLAYPLAFISTILQVISPLSQADALTLATKALPPILGIASIVLLFLVISRIFDRQVALLSALAFSVMPMAYLVQAAGYVDRDSLSLLLIMAGAFTFYLSGNWHMRWRGRDVGWVIGGIAVVLIGEVIHWEWVWVGRWLMMSILMSFFVLWLVVCYVMSARGATSSGSNTDSGGNGGRLARVKAVLRDLNWKAFCLIIMLVIVSEFAFDNPTDRLDWATDVVVSRTETASDAPIGNPPVLEKSPGLAGDYQIIEMQGLMLIDLLAAYQMLGLPLVAGFIIAARRRSKADIFILSWFVILFLLGLFARRNLIYAIPAASVLAGIGLLWFFDFSSRRRWWRLIKRAATVSFVVLLFISSFFAFSVGSGGRVSPNSQWIEALDYLREETPQDAVIMAWWDYGYFIRDVADRKPLVDNGHQGDKSGELYDVAWAYCTSEAKDVSEIMKKRGVDYFILSDLDIGLLPVITRFATGYSYGDGQTIPEEMDDTLFARVLGDDFNKGDGLEVVYRSEEVVILGLE